MREWVFDVDGVITNLDTRKVEHPQIIQRIAEKLGAGEPVGIITGRETPWLIDTVIRPIEEGVAERSALDNLCVEAEFGGVSILYTNGQRRETVDQTLLVPPTIMESAGRIVNDEFSDVVFVPGKQTHFTAELKEGVDREVFKPRRRKLADKLRQLVEESGLTQDLEVHEDALAVNVKNKRLNKHLATDKFLKWLDSKGVKPEIFYVFGDSASDLQIAEELHSQSRNVKFVYTGKDELGEKPFEIIKTQEPYDRGALEYLESNA